MSKNIWQSYLSRRHKTKGSSLLRGAGQLFDFSGSYLDAERSRINEWTVDLDESVLDRAASDLREDFQTAASDVQGAFAVFRPSTPKCRGGACGAAPSGSRKAEDTPSEPPASENSES